jgi:hypothetical protein
MNSDFSDETKNVGRWVRILQSRWSGWVKLMWRAEKKNIDAEGTIFCWTDTILDPTACLQLFFDNNQID